MAERRTTRSRPKDDDRPQDDERPQDDNLAEEYDDDLPPEEDGQAGDDAEAGDEVGDDAGQDEDADRRPPTRRKPRRATGGRSASGGRRPGLTAAEVARAGAEQIAELTGKPPETVTQVQPNGDSWTVGVEVVEDRRVPSSTDLMGLYEIDLDRSGDLLSYRRVKRYSRGRGDYGEDS
jgi:hypothetical protein